MNDPRTADHLLRHRGLFTDDEADRLAGLTVAVAGVGGVGGRLAETLARMGIGNLRLADPDSFSASNLNRQGSCTVEALGRLKVDVVGATCAQVSPIARVRTYPTGIDTSNVEDFVAGADIVVDGTDYTVPSLGLMLARAAARRDVPVVLGVEVAFAAWHTVIRGAGTFERLFGIDRATTLEQLDAGHVEIPLWRWVGRLPPHVERGTIEAVARGDYEAPAVAPAVELSAALLSTDVLRLALGQKPTVQAPRIHLVDLVSGRARKFRPTYAGFVASTLVRR